MSQNKERKIGLKIILVLLSLMFAFVSVQKIIGVPTMMDNMAALNYGNGLTRLIGVVEIIAVVALWISKFRNLSLAILIVILAGAAGSHIAGGHPWMQVIPAVTLSLLAAIALLLNDRQETLNYFLK